MSVQNVLFDAPGPKAKVRHSILTAAGALAVLAALWAVYAKFKDAGQLEPALWTVFFQPDTWTEYLLPGLWGTVRAAAISIVLAGVLGLLLGVGRLSEVTAVRWVCGLLTEFFRAVPVLIMMIFFFTVYAQNGVFTTDLNPMMAVITALTLYNGAVLAELVRSGVFGLPKGQREAGLSIGLTPSQTMRTVQLPQALRAMLPALLGQCVVILKDTALGSIITYGELLNWSKTLGSARGNTIPAYLFAGLLFIVINFTLTWVAGKVDQRMSRRGFNTHPAQAVMIGAAADTAANAQAAGAALGDAGGAPTQ